MKVSAAEIPLFTEQQIAEKAFKIDWGVVDTFYQILVIGPYQSIAEIPGMVGKQVVVNIESRRAEVLYRKDGCGSRIALSKGMNLPNPGNKTGDMRNHLILREAFVMKRAFILDIVLQSAPEVFPVQIAYGVSFQHPFFL